MTAATAITQRAHCLTMFTLVKIPCMTSSTAVAISRVGPGHRLAVAAVTRAVAASDGDTVVAGIVDGAVPIGNTSPTAGGVAKITLTGRNKVRGRFARRTAAVMTVGATRSHAGMVKTSRLPRCGGVTAVALQCGREMGGRFTCSAAAVVTAGTRRSHASVAKTGRLPGSSGVASTTLQRGEQMVGGLTCCPCRCRTVVA